MSTRRGGTAEAAGAGPAAGTDHPGGGTEGELRARLHPVDPAVDLVEVWDPSDGFLLEQRGEGLATSGSAAAVLLPPGRGQLMAAADAGGRLLATVRGDGASDAVVMVELPYDGGVEARVVLPARVVWRRDASARELRIDRSGLRLAGEIVIGALDSAAHGARGNGTGDRDAAPDPPRTHEEPSRSDYAAAVSEAVRRIGTSLLVKVVLARTLRVEGVGAGAARGITRALRRDDPLCHTFGAPGARPGTVLVGATPELVLRRRGAVVLSSALGGSAPRVAGASGDAEVARRLLRSTKDRREHALVVEAVASALAPHCVELDVPDEPGLTATAGMWHLGTTVRGRLREPAPSALELAAVLHPTPAVCGSPREAALATIRDLESIGRGLYAGLTGWMDGRGDGDCVLNLRCAELGPGSARLYAGAGIVEGSVAESEVDETGAKFGTLLAAIRGTTGRS